MSLANCRNVIFVVALVAVPQSVATAAPLQIAYQGRLVSADGAPRSGTVSLEVSFFRSASGGTALLAPRTLDNIELTDGVFTLDLDFVAADFHALFADDNEVWIQLKDLDQNLSLPRQRLNAAPFANKIPVDGTTLAFDSDGKLAVSQISSAQVSGLSAALAGKADSSALAGKADAAATTTALAGKADAAATTTALASKADAAATTTALAGKADTAHSHTLAGDVAGDIASTTVTKLQGVPVDSTAPNTVGQVLKWDGSQWAPGPDDGGVAGAVSNGSNLGGGNNLFKTVNGNAMEFRTVTGSGNISASTVGDNIQIATTAGLTSSAQAGLVAAPYGTGAGNTGELRFQELAAGGANYVAFKAPDALASDTTYTLPTAAPASNGQVLIGSTAGALSWTTLPSALPPSGAAGGDLAGSYPNPTIAAAAVTSTALAAGAVTTAKIANGAVTGAELAADAVTSAKIAADTITAADIAADAVGSSEIAADAVTTSKLADSAVTTSKLAASAVDTAAIAAGAVTGAKIASGAVDTTKLAAGAVTATELANDAVTNSKIADSAVTSAKILDGTIANADISGTAAIADSKLATISTAGKVSGAAITSGTIGGSAAMDTTGNIAGSGNVTVKGTGAATTELRFNDNDNSNYVSFKSPGTVAGNVSYTLPSVAPGSNGDVLASTTAGALSWTTLPSALPPSGAAGGSLSGSYPNPTIAVGAVTATELAADAVTTIKLTDGSVNSAKILDGTIADADISGSAAIADSKLATISTAGKVSGAAITSGTIAGTTAVNSSGTITTSGNYVVKSTGGAATEIRFNDNDDSNYVGFKSSGTVAANKIWVLPNADGGSGQLLKTDGAGNLGWVSGAAPTGSASGDLTGSYPGPTLAADAVTSAKILDGAIADADVNAAAAIARSKLASGTNNHVLINNGSGVMSSEAQLAASRGGTGISSTATFPSSGVIVTETATETLTNKTLTSPTLNTPTINGGTMGAALGAVGTPSYAFSGDADTGAWSSGANTFNVSTGGGERLRIDSSGNVGIGTTSPSSKLEVDGGNAAIMSGNTLRLYRPDNGSYGVLKVDSNQTMQIYSGGSSGQLNIMQNGNVGIGTTSPSWNLQVQGSASGAGVTSGVINTSATSGSVASAVYQSNTANAYLNVFNQQAASPFGFIGTGSADTGGLYLDVSANAPLMLRTNGG